MRTPYLASLGGSCQRKLTDEGKTKGQQDLSFCLIRHGFAVPPSPAGKALTLASLGGSCRAQRD